MIRHNAHTITTLDHANDQRWLTKSEHLAERWRDLGWSITASGAALSVGTFVEVQRPTDQAGQGTGYIIAIDGAEIVVAIEELYNDDYTETTVCFAKGYDAITVSAC